MRGFKLHRGNISNVSRVYPASPMWDGIVSHPLERWLMDGRKVRRSLLSFLLVFCYCFCKATPHYFLVSLSHDQWLLDWPGSKYTPCFMETIVWLGLWGPQTVTTMQDLCTVRLGLLPKSVVSWGRAGDWTANPANPEPYQPFDPVASIIKMFSN